MKKEKPQTQKKAYHKPEIKVTPIKLNHFSSRKEDFFAMNGLFGNTVYMAQWST